MRITLRKLPLALGPLPSPSHGSFQNECPLPIKIPMLGLDLEHFTTAASLGSEEQVLLERSGSQPWSVGMGLAHASGSLYFAVHVSHPSPSPLPTEGHSGCFLFFFFSLTSTSKAVINTCIPVRFLSVDYMLRKRTAGFEEKHEFFMFIDNG